MLNFSNDLVIWKEKRGINHLIQRRFKPLFSITIVCEENE